jgi:hypothetical protein
LFAGFEVGFEEFFPLVFGDGTVDGVFQAFCFVGHSDLLFDFQIWLRGPAKVYPPVVARVFGRALLALAVVSSPSPSKCAKDSK